MRKELKAIGKQERHTFSGVFVREGLKSAYRGLPLPTVLLKDVKLKDSDKIITDHLWFNKTKGFEALNLKEGDIVQFDARIDSYTKGYQGYREDVCSYTEIDYKLSYPTKIKLIKDHQ